MSTKLEQTLEPYQRDGRDFALANPRCLILDPPGTGKTHQGLALIEALRDRGELGKVLIATPGEMLGSQWVAHLKTYLPDLKVLEANTGSKAYREIQQTDGPVAMIFTYAMLLGHKDWATQVPRWSLMILDEVSVLKGALGQQRAAREVSRHSDRVLGLTATELENSAVDTWAILDAVGTPGLWGRGVFENEFMDWRDAFEVDGQTVPRKALGIKPEKLPEVQDYMAVVALRRSEDELGLVLPQRVGPEVMWVQPTPEQRSSLRQIDRATYLSLLARHAKQRKACSVVNGTSGKALAALSYLLGRPEHEKVLVYAENYDHLDVMERLLSGRGIGHVRIQGLTEKKKRLGAVERFNTDPSVRVLLGTSVLERGLDGLKIASALLSLGSSYNPAREAQREGRLRRLRSPHRTYEHVTFLLDHPHERKKWEQTLAEKREHALDLRTRTAS